MPTSAGARITWETTYEGHDGFTVERGTSPGNLTPIASVLPGVNEFEDEYLEEETTYYYAVRMVQGFAISNRSNILAILTVPTPPHSLIVIQREVESIEISWDTDSTSHDGFEIQRSLSPLSDWETVGIVDKTESTYLDEDLEPATEYFYRVKSYRNDTPGTVYSNSSSVASGYTMPPEIDSFLVEAWPESMKLFFSPEMPFNGEFVIQVSRDGGDNWESLSIVSSTETEYTDASDEIEWGTEYHYRITSINENGDNSTIEYVSGTYEFYPENIGAERFLINMDPSDLHTIFSEVTTLGLSGVTRVGLGDPVGAIINKSLLYNDRCHASIGTLAAKPECARWPEGGFCLSFDGIDDKLAGPFVTPLYNGAVSASSEKIFQDGSNYTKFMRIQVDTPSSGNRGGQLFGCHSNVSHYGGYHLGLSHNPTGGVNYRATIRARGNTYATMAYDATSNDNVWAPEVPLTVETTYNSSNNLQRLLINGTEVISINPDTNQMEDGGWSLNPHMMGDNFAALNIPIKFRRIWIFKGLPEAERDRTRAWFEYTQPGIPENLTLTENSPGDIDLDWSNGSNSINNILIEESDDLINWSSKEVLEGTPTNHNLTGLPTGYPTYYRLVSRRNLHRSEESEPVYYNDPIGDALRAVCFAEFKFDEPSDGSRKITRHNEAQLGIGAFENGGAGINVPSTNGIIGRAALFSSSNNGILSFVRNAALNALLTDSYWFSYWVYQPSTFAGDYISKDNSNTFNSYYSSNRFRFAHRFASGTVTAVADILGAATGGNWYFVLNSVDNDDKKTRISVNGGAFDESSAATGDIHTSDHNIDIGRRSASATAFNGAIQYVQFFTGKPTTDMVDYLYNSGIPRALYHESLAL